MEKPIISIIVPVYNTARYVHACIDSVLTQSFSNLELLLVDDGSTDGSGDICDECSGHDERIRVFHQENSGVSSARNKGLEEARGEWLFFLDSDDLLPDRALEVLMAQADSTIDMVYGALRKFDENEDNIETIMVEQQRVLSIEEALDSFVAPNQRNGDWHRYMVNRIYRLHLIRKYRLRFMTGIYYKEDGLFLAQYLCRCARNAVCIPDIVYLYRQVQGSAMMSLETAFNPRLLTNIDSHGYIYRELVKRDVQRDIIKREFNEIFQNYEWIGWVMKQAGAFTKENKRLLMKRIIKNAGPVNTFYRFVVLHYSRKIKRKLLCILH